MNYWSEDDFKSFYLDTFPALRVFIFAKCADTELAEDLAQESMMRLWNNKSKVEKSKAKSYVFTVSANLFLDHIRHQKVKYNYSAAFSIKSDIKDPQYYLEMEEFRIKMDKALQSMSEASREVFLLSRVEKMTYKQIADSLGLSVKAIEKRMQKAIEIMGFIT